MRGTLLVLCCLAGLANPRPAAPQTPPVFGAEVETVYVDAFVTRKGRHVPGLAAADFELRDNGVRQELKLVAAESIPLLAVLVFDTSGSVSGEKLEALRTAGMAFLASLRPSDEAALVTFSQQIEWRAGPTTDRGQMRRALEDLNAAGAMAAALDALFTGLILPASRARTLVLLFSDGEDNMSWLGEQDLRAAAEGSNALVHAVSLRAEAPAVWTPGSRPAGEPEHVRMLRGLAEATGGRLWEAKSPDRIRAAFGSIAEAMSQRYVLRYEPRGVKRPGRHEIDLRLRGKDGDVHARRGYWVGAR